MKDKRGFRLMLLSVPADVMSLEIIRSQLMWIFSHGARWRRRRRILIHRLFSGRGQRGIDAAAGGRKLNGHVKRSVRQVHHLSPRHAVIVVGQINPGKMNECAAIFLANWRRLLCQATENERTCTKTQKIVFKQPGNICEVFQGCSPAVLKGL